MAARICAVPDCKKHAWHNSTKCAKHQNTQAKCFERWIGQTVYREEKPTLGPLYGQTLGYIRGTITRLYKDKFDRDVAEVRWHNRINWQTGEIEYRECISRGYFVWGLHTIFELQILLNGGLLSSLHPNGIFTEPQPKSLIEQFPIFQKIINNRNLDVIR